MTHHEATEEIIALHEGSKRLHARIERLEVALRKVDALIVVDPATGCMWLNETGQNEAAHAVRAALAPQEETR